MTQSPFRPSTDAEIAILDLLLTRLGKVAAGDYLYRAGDTRYDFFVVLAGLVEISVDSVRRGPRGYLARGWALPR